MGINYNTPPVVHSAMVHTEQQNGLICSSLHEQLGELTNGKFVHTDLITKGPWVDVRAFGAVS